MRDFIGDIICLGQLVQIGIFFPAHALPFITHTEAIARHRNCLESEELTDDPKHDIYKTNK